MPPQRQPAAQRRTAKPGFLGSRGMGASGVPARLRAGWKAQGKKVRRSSCGKAVEAQPSSGQTAINRGHRGCPNPGADRPTGSDQKTQAPCRPRAPAPGQQAAIPGIPPTGTCPFPALRAAAPRRRAKPPPSPDPAARPTRCRQPPAPNAKRQSARPRHRRCPGTLRQRLSSRHGDPAIGGRHERCGRARGDPNSASIAREDGMAMAV